MIIFPDDPVEVLAQRIKRGSHLIALHLMDDSRIMNLGMNTQPNKIVTTALYFEKLEAEPNPRRRVAQQLRRSQERTHKATVGRLVNLCASLYAARRM